MPYAKKSELPDAVQEYPEHAQDIWMSAFNAAKKSGKYSEKQCFKIAWAALRKKFDIKGGKSKAEMDMMEE